VDPSSAPWRVVDAPPAPLSPGSSPAAPSVQPRGKLLVGAGVIALLVVAAIAVAAGLVGGPGSPDDGGLVVDASGEPTGSAQLVVDVGGAVLAPGVYRLAHGSRVGDAVAAAGGFGPRVDAERAAAELNLAALLEDGAHIVVPSRDDRAAASGQPGAGGGGGGGGTGGLLDLNAATQAELEALPGIGPVTALKILDARDEAPFTSVEDLRTRKLVGEKTFEGLRDLVTVR
jgi:competence protein ComEA